MKELKLQKVGILPLTILLILTCGFYQAANAQNLRLDSSFNGGVTDASTQNYVSTVQPDGKILVGGSFNFVNGTRISGFARLNSDGSLDTTFNPPAGIGSVLDIIVLSNGKIIIGGSFNVGGLNNLARLNADGTLDTTFNPGGSGTSSNAAGRITSLMLQPDGKILVGAQGTTGYNGVTSNGIFRVNADGTFDNTFVSGFATTPSIEQIILQPDGKVLVSGFFTGYGSNATIAYFIRVNSNGSLDTTFNAGGSGVDGVVAGMGLQPDGKIVIGGAFTTYNGTARNNIARVNADGSLDTGFVPPNFAQASGFVEFFAIQPDGKILAAGIFDNGLGSKYAVIRMNSNGSLDSSLLDPADSFGYHVGLQADGKILVVGGFTRFTTGGSHLGIARFNANGTIDSAFNTSTTRTGAINTLAVQTDGKIVVGGQFLKANGSAATNIVRFNADGTRDNTFSTGTGPTPDNFNFVTSINAVAIQADGKILVGGQFGSFNGAVRIGLVRLNSDGSVDTSFNLSGDVATGFPLVIQEINVLPDGKILIGGSIRNSATAFRGLMRLNADGSVDSSFNSGTSASNIVYRIIRQPDGKILIGGAFTNYNGTARQRVARLNADGSLDTAFSTGAGATNGIVYDLGLQTDGKVVIGGAFTTLNGNAQNRIARLNTDGTFDSTFNVGTGANDIVYTVLVQPNGKVLIGGFFTTYNGTARARLARLNADGSLDTSFVSGLDTQTGFVRKLLSQTNGRVLVGGTFTTFNGATRNSILRLRVYGTSFDFDGDGKADQVVFRPTDGVWYLLNSTTGFTASQFGVSTDKITPADFDGDNKTDLAVFRNGVWYWVNSSNGVFNAVQFGQSGDVPVPADYTGDGRAELAVYRGGVWYTLNLANNQFNGVQFGVASDKPVPADFDGDGRADFAVFRDGVWYWLRSSDNGFVGVQFGVSTDKPVVGDYDGDGKADPAVYRDGVWYILGSSRGFTAVQFGIASDTPVAADFDGDGNTDLAVFRSGVWYLLRSQQGFGAVQFGAANDKPIPAAYVP